jgi:hypothetical protein
MVEVLEQHAVGSAVVGVADVNLVVVVEPVDDDGMPEGLLAGDHEGEPGRLEMGHIRVFGEVAIVPGTWAVEREEEGEEALRFNAEVFIEVEAICELSLAEHIAERFEEHLKAGRDAIEVVFLRDDGGVG